MEERLANASVNELKGLLRDRFQMRGPWAADTGTRESEFPYDLPLELWKEADEGLRRRLVQAARDLLAEIPGEGWSAEAIEWLVAFIDRADLTELIPALQSVAERGQWLKGTDDGPRCHMLVLRTLLGLGWKGTPSFWRGLPDEINARYPALGFRGLLAQGDLAEAFAHLPHVLRDKGSATRIIDVLSPLVRRVGSGEVRKHLRLILARLPREVKAEFQRWFRVHGWGRLVLPREKAPRRGH